jgi:prepilin-type N-terminal cleavage/methylation domain-containing protein
VRNNTLSHGTGADGAFPSRASDPAHKNDAGKSGFTLIELLVVISIMAALTALMLPRLRTVNQDRGIREAARVVGSKFAEASDRARRDGAAAVTLFRNPNMVDVNGVQFGVSTISISRAVPNYPGGSSGETGTKRARVVGGNMFQDVLRIPRPLEQSDLNDNQEDLVRVGDFVRVSASPEVSTPVSYRIVDLDPPNVMPPRTVPDQLDIQLDLVDTKPDFPGAVGTTPLFFVIERQPKILRSSITDLPPGYTVDLRLSGPLQTMETMGNSGIVDGTGTPIGIRPLFYEKRRDAVADGSILANAYNRIDILFDSTGGISSVRTYRGNWDGFTTGSPSFPDPDGEQVNQAITGPLELFVTPSELEADGGSPLYDETNLWVTISNTSGGVNIGYNNPPLAAGGTTLGELVTEARRTASTGQSASQ